MAVDGLILSFQFIDFLWLVCILFFLLYFWFGCCHCQNKNYVASLHYNYRKFHFVYADAQSFYLAENWWNKEWCTSLWLLFDFFVNFNTRVEKLSKNFTNQHVTPNQTLSHSSWKKYLLKYIEMKYKCLEQVHLQLTKSTKIKLSAQVFIQRLGAIFIWILTSFYRRVPATG